MQRTVAGRFLSLLPLIAIACASTSFAQGTLVWSDEFNGSTLNTNNWEPMIGNGQLYGIPGWGNNELQYYTDRPENVYVADGYLHIVARRERFAGYNYTSARLRTLGKRDFRYGRFEARIKLAQGGQGIWPAFWMLPTGSPYGGWAASGEIDIMEAVGVPTTIHGTIHHGGAWPRNVQNGGSYNIGINFADAFHVYAIEWEEDEIRWYLDGVQYFSVDSDTWYSENEDGNNRAPFDTPFHFLLNMAVGGNWPGNPNAGTPFPQVMQVDWVRVYDQTIVAPEVTITAPSNGTEVPAGPVQIDVTATTSAGTILGVQFLANGEVIGSDASSPYSLTWNATEGCYLLSVIAANTVGGNSSDEITIDVGNTCVGDPYLGFPAAIPGLVEAENYDNGGEGVAYQDCDSSNEGGAYRPNEGVDIEQASGSNYNVGWMCDGEWINYAVDVAQSGYYKVAARVASNTAGGAFALEFDGIDRTGDITAPGTGGWQIWTQVVATMQLSAGIQEMRFVNKSGSGEFNIDHLIFTYHADHDYDFDGDVDHDDWTTFSNCLTGPDSTSGPGPCLGDDFEHSDADDDNDADMHDFATLQRSTNS